MLTISGRGTPQSNARTRADEDQKGIVLGRMVELNTSLVCLDISRMKLTDDDAAHLIRALDVNTTLKSVSTATAGSGRESCRDSCPTLTGGRCCEQLSLAANQLRECSNSRCGLSDVATLTAVAVNRLAGGHGLRQVPRAEHLAGGAGPVRE